MSTDKLIFCLDHNVFDQESLEFYQEYKTRFEKDLYAFYQGIDYKAFIDNYYSKNFLFFDESSFVLEEEKDFRFENNTVVHYRSDGNREIFQDDFGGVIVFGKIIIKQYYILHNFTFIEIDFEDAVWNPQVIQGDLIDESLFTFPFIIFDPKNSNKINLFCDESFTNKYLSCWDPERFEEFKKYEAYSKILNGKAEIYPITEEQAEQIKNLSKINFNLLDSFSDKIEKFLMSNYDFFHRVCKIIEKNVSLNLYHENIFENSDLNEWAQKNTRDSYSCCDDVFNYSAGSSWFVFADTLRERKIPPYYEKQYELFKEAFRKVDPVVEGTYMFRGLFLKNNRDVSELEKGFSSYSANLSTALYFSRSFFEPPEPEEKKIVLFHKVTKEENIKTVFITGKYSDKFETMGLSEFVMQDNTKSTFEHAFDFGDTSFIQITNFERISEEDPEIDYRFEEYYGIEQIIKNRDCFFLQYSPDSFNFFYFRDEFSKIEISKLKRFEINFFELEVPEGKYFPIEWEFYSMLTSKKNNCNNLFISKSSKHVKEFIKTIDCRAVLNPLDFVNFMTSKNDQR